jgi:hypothetical protein
MIFMRSVAHEQCLGRLLLVRNINQNLIPGIRDLFEGNGRPRRGGSGSLRGLH